MSYEAEDWYDLGDSARNRYLQPDEESDMPDANNKFPVRSLQDWQTNDEIPVKVQFLQPEHRYNPYHGPRLPLLTEEEIIARASYWDREWEAKSGLTKRGWRKAHRNPRNLSLMLPAGIAFGLVAVLLLVAWVWL